VDTERRARLLDALGQFLMKQVRDPAIGHLDSVISGQMQHALSRRFRSDLKALGPGCQAVVEQLIPIAVDTVLFELLVTVEQSSSIDLVVTDLQKRESARDISDGLAGELYTEDGWIERFSQARKSPEPLPPEAF
jgi:hypothetical protein